ncbi:hypothetical protein G6F65_019670 [Rhizopus arrhizus]|nr:hypothetical protein G6F65_019670 [Rhizopus arrhizus]
MGGRQRQVQGGARLGGAGRQPPAGQGLAGKVMPGLHGVQRLVGLGDGPAQEEAAAVVPVTGRRQARQPEDQCAGQGIRQQQAAGAAAKGAQAAPVGADGSPIGANLAAHGNKILLGHAIEQVAGPRAGADHQGQATGLQGAQAGQTHANVAHPIG